MITAGTIQGVKKAMEVFSTVFTASDVTLVDTGAVIQPKLIVVIRATGGVLRSSRALELTGGSDMDMYVCLIDPDSWAALSPGRPPKKGDVVDWGGVRMGIQRVVLAQYTGIQMYWKAELRG